MKRMGFVAAGFMGIALLGCQAEQPAMSEGIEREIPQQQAMSLTAVKILANDLSPGMTRAEVLTLLGAPAEYRGDVWVYRSREGDEQLLLRFDNDRYVGREAAAAQERG